jgi:hypothetical protein
VSRAASFLPPFIPLGTLARVATACLAATAAAAWLAVGVAVRELALLAHASGGEHVAPAARDAWSLTHEVLVWLRAALFAATAAAFLGWLLQARINLRAMGVRRLRFARSWAVTAFLVPVLNAFRPYQVLHEVWQASDPGHLDPFQWRDAEVPNLLPLWWGALLLWVGLAALALLTGIGTGGSLPRLQLAAALRALADGAGAVAASLACLVVARLSAAQEAKQRRLSGVEPAPAEAALAT